MRTLSFGISACSAWAVFAYRIRDLRRDPGNPFLRSFCVLLGLIAASYTVGIPAILSRVERATGVLAIWNTGLITVGCGAGLATLLLWARPADRAWPAIRRRWALFGLVLVVILVLAVVGRVDPSAVDIAAHAERPESLYGQTPYAAESVLIFLLAVIYTMVESSRLYFHVAAAADRRWLRRGLRVAGVASACGGGFAVANALFVVALRFGVTIEALHRTGMALVCLGALSGAVGYTMPTWGPRLDRVVAYHRLHPLWVALYRATPAVVLHPPRLPRADRWNPWDVNYRLYRRTIEIRDARLALRRHLDRQVADRARRLADAAGLTGDTLDAVVEAAVLAAGIQARLGDRRPAERFVAEVDRGGSDLATEVEWLGLVADAFTRSPLVGAALEHRERDYAGGGCAVV